MIRTWAPRVWGTTLKALYKSTYFTYHVCVALKTIAPARRCHDKIVLVLGRSPFPRYCHRFHRTSITGVAAAAAGEASTTRCRIIGVRSPVVAGCTARARTWPLTVAHTPVISQFIQLISFILYTLSQKTCTLCQHTDARYWYSKSVCLSVRPFVCPSVYPWRFGIRWKRLNISS